MFMKHCGLDPVDFVPEKYTVAGGIKFLKSSLDTVSPVPLSIQYQSLQISSPPILPPHSRIPKGRPRKKRLTKNHKRKRHLQNRREKLMQQAIEDGDPYPEIEGTVHVRRNYSCHLCGGQHTSTRCRLPHDGMGHSISTAEQNACLASGFLIIEIQKLGETILPKDLDEYNNMRMYSDMSRNSFDRDAAVLSDSDDEYDAKNSVGNNAIDDDTLIVGGTDDIGDEHVPILDVKNPSSQSEFKTVEHNDTHDLINSTQSSDNETKNVVLSSDESSASGVISHSGDISTEHGLQKEAYTFLPQCTHCINFHGIKISNPWGQIDSVGQTKYDSYQNAREWFDAGLVVSYQVACYHDIHPTKTSMFIHMGSPCQNPQGYPAVEEEAYERLLLDIASGDNASTPKSIDLSKDYERHLGVVYSSNHFEVVEFIISSQIIVIYNGL
jgi:hypothetical protein